MSEPSIETKEQAAYEEALRRIDECGQRNFRTLDLSGIGLRAVPPEISRLTTLRVLGLSNNQLSTLPTEIGRLTALTELRLSRNHLSFLPAAIVHLTELKMFSLSGNQLTALPGEIGQLIMLERLYLDNNQLRVLPAEIGQLTGLTGLYLSTNQLRFLPVEIGQLTDLVTLTIGRNQLQELPHSLRLLSRLKELTLHENPALTLPTEVLGPTFAQSSSAQPPANPREILSYYFASRGDGGQALREIKVLVVGRPGAGKTSLIRRLAGQPLDPHEPETHGIAIEPLSLPCAGGPVEARVWDFGGQHVLHAMHEFFFTGRSFYILVLSEREDLAERDAEYWLQVIRSYAGDAPVIVALNKAGKRARELDLPHRRLEESYGPILGWMPTECVETDEQKGGIRALRQAMTRVIGEMPEIQARFPRKWVEIKDWLAGMQDNYLPYSTYEARCASLGEKDPGKQEELAGFLHDLGVALNFRRDPRLHETTVLRPDWLADGIYALLRANDARHPIPLAPEGRLTLAQMPAIYAAAERLRMLRASDYPAEKHTFLLRLMSAFQLSFPLDEHGQEQLVPALLGVEEPSDPPWPAAGASLELRWEFPVVPAPLLPRLLVRTFGLVVKERCWRRGAFYAYGSARAKIWEERERLIFLSVGSDGGEPREADANDLVHMIRETLRAVISEYKSLAAQEQVRWKNDWLPRRLAEELGLCPAANNPSRHWEESL